jgi:hypothetical protein
MTNHKTIFIACLFNFVNIIGYAQVNEKVIYSLSKDAPQYHYVLSIERDTTSNHFIERNETITGLINLDSLIYKQEIQKLSFETYLKGDLIESVRKLDGKVFSEINPFNFSKEISKYRNGELVQRSLYEIEDDIDYAQSAVSLHWYFTNNVLVSEAKHIGTLIKDSIVFYSNGMCKERFDLYYGKVESHEKYDSNGRLEILETSLNKRRQIIIERKRSTYTIKKVRRKK